MKAIRERLVHGVRNTKGPESILMFLASLRVLAEGLWLHNTPTLAVPSMPLIYY